MTQPIINEILEREGWPKYTNDPDDRGGPTKGGITLATLSERLGHPATIEELQNLTEHDAKAIYAKRYIDQPGFNKIKNDLLCEHVIDAGVLHGQRTATKWLQAIAGVMVDGVLGPISLGAINAMSVRDVNVKFAAMRIRYIGNIINKNYKARKYGLTKKDQSRFTEGWLTRATSFLLEM